MQLTLSTSLEQIQGQIHLSSSKSESNRVLIMNALSGNKLLLENLSDARDTQTMQHLLTITNKEWNVLDAGTTMRFCTALLSIIGDNHVITGTERMKDRPIGLLVDALRKIGAEITYLEKDRFPPLKINKLINQKTDRIDIPGNISSQFISALLMISPSLPKGLSIDLVGEIYSRPYIEMTLNLMAHFGIKHSWVRNNITIKPQKYKSDSYTVESDWSGASYWYSLAALAPKANIELHGLREFSFQGDRAIASIMEKMGVHTEFKKGSVLLKSQDSVAHYLEIDFRRFPDLAQTIFVVAAAKNIKLKMKGLESLKIKETDRIEAMKNELLKIGSELIERDGYWELIPGPLPTSISPIDTYEDHRMAMSFAPLSVINDITINDPEVVKKSYPGFWQDLKSIGINIRENL